MNQFVHEDIFSIIRKLEKEEIKEFQDSKGKKTGKGEKEYLKLFNEYLRQEEEDDIDIEKLKSSCNSFSNTNPDLKEQLIAFLLQKYNAAQQNSESLENIKLQIKRGKALLERGLYNLAETELLPVYDTAKHLYNKKRKSDHLQGGDLTGYLTELHFLLTEIYYKNQGASLWKRNDEVDQNLIRPMVQFASAHFPEELRASMPGGDNNNVWQQYAYHEILRIYYREKKRYDKLKQIDESISNSYTAAAMRSLRNQSVELPEANELPFYLWQFERMFASLVTREYSEFQFQFQQLKNQYFIHFQEDLLNIHFIIFCYKKLFQLAAIYSGQQADTTLLKDLTDFTKKHLHLFEEKEIKNTGILFHVNDALLKFLMRDFQGFIDKIQEQDVVKKLEKLPEYFYPLQIMLLFAYRIGQVAESHDIRDSIERKIERKFLKGNEDTFMCL